MDGASASGTGMPASDFPGGNGISKNASQTSQKLRKRTKTGCLTCRKRRIKCGEERPTCANCIKSKRLCEGYSQKLSWRPPIAEWGSMGDDGQATMLTPSNGSYRPIPPPIDTGGFGQMRPPNGLPYAVNEHGEPLFSPPSAGIPYAQQLSNMPMASPHTPFPPSWTPITPQYGQPNFGQSPMSAMSNHSMANAFTGPPPQQHMPMSAASQYPSYTNHDTSSGQSRHSNQVLNDVLTPASSIHQEGQSYFPESSNRPEDSELVQEPGQQTVGPVCWWEPARSDNMSESEPSAAWVTTTDPQSSAPYSGTIIAQHGVSNGQFVSTSQDSAMPAPTAIGMQPAKFLGESYSGATGSFLEAAAIQNHDDGYYDVQSEDEEMADEDFKRLGLIRALHKEHLQEISLRRYDTFLYNGMLDHYRAEEVANPLGNQHTARVFAHFIFATGPSLSIFERYPQNPNALFVDQHVNYQQGLWTYTLPMKAIRHQGLLHAMLALASLHIAKLQGTAETPSYKHYSYAIKSIHKSVGNPKKKLLPTTIAATLLLGFYEILTADHMKWASHLAGAKQLLQQLPLRRMAREAKRLRAQQLATQDQYGLYDGNQLASTSKQTFRDIGPNIDEKLLSRLMGRQVNIDSYGEVFSNDEPGASASSSQPLDMDKYELYQDLYWWYARQDVYQAILSGNKLLLDYHRWADCPPRAGMGRSDAIFGTHDHLILLFARVADFNARDRKRKIRVMEANGGHWRPAPGMNIPKPPGPPPPQAMPMHTHTQNPNAPFTPNHFPPNYAPGPPGTPQQFAPPNVPMAPPPQPTTPYQQSSFTTAQLQQIPGAHSASSPAAAYAANGFGNMPFQNAGRGLSASPNFQAGQPFIKQENNFSQASPNAPYAIQSAMAAASGQPNVPFGSAGAFSPAPPPPTFYGMAPLPTTVNIPSSYAANLPQSSPSPKSEKADYDIESATSAALTEWTQIKAALSTFESNLGQHFQPLPSDVHVPTLTPFGPAIFYRSHDIGIIWAMYYMACIIVERCHPHMPPAAMMAAGIAASRTTAFAARIGQIVGGIVPMPMGPDLSPSLGACLCESSLPLFFAGVSYQDATQRRWLVTLLRDVELRTGWKSIGMVAQGCETAWEKAGLMGRGAPYKRQVDAWHAINGGDVRVAKITGNYEGVDPEQPSGAAVGGAGARVHWAMGLLSEEEKTDEVESRHASGVQPAKELVN